MSFVSMKRGSLAAGLAVLALLPAHGETRDLLKGEALGGFREVAGWRGVEKVSAVEGQGEFVLEGDGGILVYASKKGDKVLVNGQLVQENASTGGHTRSAPLEGDATQGPIAIQGDHGPVAIRSYKVTPLPDPEIARLAELDAYWAEVSRSVNQGDFEAYKASCHEKAVLVSGTKKISYPLSQALARWKQEFDDTKAGKIKASVEFRFSHRYGDAKTAHESGVFLYTQQKEGAEPNPEYIGFEALLVKENDAWKILMEYQKDVVTKADWDALSNP